MMASLIDIEKEISAVDGKLADIAKALSNKDARYTPKSWDPNFVGPNDTVRIPQFSDARNTLLDLQGKLQVQKATLVAEIQQKTTTYKQPVGPVSNIVKQELAIIEKYRPISLQGQQAPATTTTVAPVQTGPNQPAVTTTPPTQPPTSGTAPATTTGTTVTTGKKPAAAKKPKKPAAVQGFGPMNLPQDVRDEFKQLFPQYAASLDGGEKEQKFVDFFGSDLIAIWVKQLNPETRYDLTDATEKAAFARDVENTAYGQRTSQNEQNFDFNPSGQAELIRIKKNEITKQYGDLQLNTEQLDAVAREAARKGYTGDDLQFAVYAFAYQQVPSTTVAGTEIADKLRNAGRAYGYTPSDAEIKAALTNTPYNGMMVTEDTIREKAQRAAKGQYKHLAEQIDAGLSLDDIFYNYKSYASKVLQVDPSQIDFVNDPKWAEAFGNDKTGQLSLNDWMFKLKSDDKYGYQFTDAARQQATNLVMGLEKAFGFRA
jgi:hypothetical protein